MHATHLRSSCRSRRATENCLYVERHAEMPRDVEVWPSWTCPLRPMTPHDWGTRGPRWALHSGCTGSAFAP